jgi:hypothetical protein
MLRLFFLKLGLNILSPFGHSRVYNTKNEIVGNRRRKQNRKGYQERDGTA